MKILFGWTVLASDALIPPRVAAVVERPFPNMAESIQKGVHIFCRVWPTRMRTVNGAVFEGNR